MENLLKKVYKNRILSRALCIISFVISLVFVLAFCFCVATMIYRENYRAALSIAASALVGYLLVSAAREVLNAPRPYEIYDFYQVKPRCGSGRSFPSRHAYSSFCIATLSYSVFTPLAIALTALALVICICRALVGIHFIRDLLAGAVIGVIAGLLGLILI